MKASASAARQYFHVDYLFKFYNKMHLKNSLFGFSSDIQLQNCITNTTVRKVSFFNEQAIVV